MYMQRTTSGAAGNGLYTTIKYMRGAASIGLGTTIKHLRRTSSGASGSGLGATMKYLRRTTSSAASNGLSTTIIPPCSSLPSAGPHTDIQCRNRRRYDNRTNRQRRDEDTANDPNS
jgi:hypothetical protein